jgi:flagellar hook-associated protein 2
MPNASIGGLVSGLDTATIITQLLQLEARPQTMLKSRVSTEEKVVTALQGLNAKLASIATKAGDLAKASGWSAVKATSSTDKVTVTAGASAIPGTVTVDVVDVATAATSTYTTAASATATGQSGATLTISYTDPSKGSVSVSAGDGSLQSIANAINADAKTGLQASLVRAGGTDTAPTYQLVVTSKQTGQSSGFTIDDGSGNFLGGSTPLSTGGTDATIKLNGTQLKQASNTFVGVMPGVDVTITAGSETTSATISVERDVTSLADSVKGMVDAVNAALDEIGTLTAYDATTKKGGLLAGDSTMRSLRNQLLETVSRGVQVASPSGGTTTETLASVGIEVDRYGKLTFDEATFTSAYAADPAKTQALLAGTDPASGTDTGFADKLAALGKAFSDSIDGTLTSAIKGRQSAVKGMQDDIADWDVRLAAKQVTLQRQYTALESALGKLQSQGTWLAGQIASLPQMSSGQ